MEKERAYIAIDLKSFYASVECAARGLNPLKTNLVVADESRTTKTICLAVSPSLKNMGVPGRPRLFEVVRLVKDINERRKFAAPGGRFSGSSTDEDELKSHPELAVDYIVAKPRMAEYMRVSTDIYKIYLKYVAPEDIFAYSVDEVFIDATGYLKAYGMSARDLAVTMIRDVLSETGITATAGIGTNLYLAKVAMDIVAKHMDADRDGVRIAGLDEAGYREKLWDHRPITDFWRVGRGYAKKLEAAGLFTMGDIARCSLGGPDDFYNEDMLYKMFGVNAELLIDHAWGWEPAGMADVKAYVPEENSMGSGQVLSEPYTFKNARTVMREMAESLSYELVDKGLVTDQIVITVGYDASNLSGSGAGAYGGAVATDHYGRAVPKHAHGTKNLAEPTSSATLITGAAVSLFDEIVNRELFIRRINVTANHVIPEGDIETADEFEQLDLFTDYDEKKRGEAERKEKLAGEKRRQKAVLDIRKKYGRNAILKGTDFEECATARERNEQIGGHKA